MSVFWSLFWLGFLGLPLMVLIASVVLGSGAGSSSTHIWVYKGTRNKVRDATNREVWEHNNPGKSWEKYQRSQFIGCAVFLVIGFLIFLVWLASELFVLPEDGLGLRLFWQIGAPILGGLSAGAFVGLQTLMENYKITFLKVLHIIALVLMGVGIIGGLVLTFIGKPLPISQHWIWAPAGATVFFLILNAIMGGVAKGREKRKQNKAIAGGGQLFRWVVYVMDFSKQYDIKNLSTIMTEAVEKLQWGEFDHDIWNQEFFELTESIILDLVSGQQMSIEDQDIYRAREPIIRAVQAFYFYSTQKVPQFKIHPRIEKALQK
jgi:hypothetical protein